MPHPINVPAETRAQLVFMLRNQGITDRDVLATMEAIPRDHFVSDSFHTRAYEDTALSINCGQTISQPSVVAKMTQALALDKRCKVLEIGTGSGYQAAILARLSRRVYTIERYKALAQQAEQRLNALDIPNVVVLNADGSLGLENQAPFDRILLTAAAEDPPSPLLAQLREGGIMVLPVGQSAHVQTMVKITKTAAGLEYEDLGDVRFVPLLPGLGQEETKES